MNLEILSTPVQKFISTNLKSDITKLILKGSPFKNISTQELIGQIEAKKKCEKKLPSWFNNSNTYYPNKLNIEQTSSEKTAEYKTSIINGEHIIDVTGGLGVDCFYFAKKFNNVTHCELNAELSDIVKHNLTQFNNSNVKCVNTDGIAYIIENDIIYDWIYIDPSRRNDTKGKVFLLEDCLPNVPKHLDNLLLKSNHLLIKSSPLLDIKSCINELKNVKNIHVIALKNEVKEVLVEIEKNYNKSISLKTINLDSTNQNFEFIFEKKYEYNLSKPLKYLYEPNVSILKSGGFNAVCEIFNIDKLHQHSHLYTSNNHLESFPGRQFKIEQCLPYHKKTILKHLPHKKANITTRNFKESVQTIRKKTGIKEGGDLYLFFTTDFNNNQIVLICKKIT